MTAETRQRSKVFISYSHKDEKWLRRLLVHLKPLELTVDVWADTKLKAGDIWLEEIKAALADARVAILLVSADFLASDFITGVELPALLDGARGGRVTVLNVILSPSLFDRVKALSCHQTVNDPRSPLIEMRRAKREAVFVEVAMRVEEILRPAPEPQSFGPPPAKGSEASRVLSVRREFLNRFDVHARRTRRNRPEEYVTAVAAPLFGLTLLLAAWLLSDFEQYRGVAVLMTALSTASFCASYLLWKKFWADSEAIGQSEYIKKELAGGGRWGDEEIRLIPRLTAALLKGRTLNR